MEQRNRLGALGYLPPLLLHGLLLFVADGERGNFAAAMGSRDPLLRPPKSASLATAEEERKRQASRSPAIPVCNPGWEWVGAREQMRVAAVVESS